MLLEELMGDRMVTQVIQPGIAEKEIGHLEAARIRVKGNQSIRRDFDPGYFKGGESRLVKEADELVENKDFYGALASYDKAVEQEPGNFMACSKAAYISYIVYLNEPEEAPGRDEYKKRAEELCEKALELRPDCSEAIELLYEIKLGEGKEKEANNFWEQLKNLDLELQKQFRRWEFEQAAALKGD